MLHPKDISISDFNYILPPDRIAAYPLAERDDSKLAILQNDNIISDVYRNLPSYLPANSMMIFNNSKVIPARILFKKESGAVIEIFCLEPFKPAEYATALQAKNNCQWKCLIGGISKWKSGTLKKNLLIDDQKVVLNATLIQSNNAEQIIEFSWDITNVEFSKIIFSAGEVPLPPYLKRKVEFSDSERYQTVFASENGSVAAPTAALHFTMDLLKQLERKSILIDYCTLHVGAGTFRPVKSSKMNEHDMHAEWMEITIPLLENLLKNYDKSVIAIGTTATRTLESVYWMGVKTAVHINIDLEDLTIKQWEVYDSDLLNHNISRERALTALITWMQNKNLNKLICKTQILIAPGYKFRMINFLITNFHQPGSTLLLLIAAAIGEQWKNLYQYALNNNYRFLSYGDGCLLKIQE